MSTVSYHFHNGTLPDREYLLEKISDEYMVQQIPAMVILAVLGLVGFIGNSFVLVFYTRDRKQYAFTAFIQTLCIADLAICCVAIPIEISDINFNYTWKSAIACKFMRYVDYTAGLLSCFTLVAIAVCRYQMVCKPYDVHVSIKQARIACAILSCIALVINTPVPIKYTSVTVNVTNEFYDDLEGKDCTHDMENAFVLIVVSATGLILLFLVAIAILAVLYSKLAYFCYKYRKNMKKEVVKRKPPQNVPCAESSASSRIGNGEQERSQQELDRENVKFIILMFTITCAFILNFLPYLIAVVWHFFNDPVKDNHYGALGTLIGRSWVLNSVVNPMIYGYFTSDFRRFVGKTVLPCVYK